MNKSILQLRGTLAGADFLGIPNFYAEQIFIHLETDGDSRQGTLVHIDFFFTPDQYEQIYPILEEGKLDYLEFYHHELGVTVLTFEAFPVTFFRNRPKLLQQLF